MTAKKTAAKPEEKQAEAKPEEKQAEAKPEEKQAEAKPEAVSAVVVGKFRDKETGSVCNVGLGLRLTRERFDEINSVGDFLKEID